MIKCFQTNKFGALLLLAVLFTNTVVGFVCSVGTTMGHGSKHSHEVHERDVATHRHSHEHHHQHQLTHVDGLKVSSANGECCTNEVTSFMKLDKAVTHLNFLIQPPVLLITPPCNYFTVFQGEVGTSVNSQFQFVRRSCFLNDIDIQTAIMRFQI